MNLRNKKTGDTGFYLHTHRDHKTGVLKIAVLEDGVSFSEFKSYEPIYDYDSLAELNEEWEDYEPAEPLIKDPKIRNAVRVWAEANDVRRVFVGGFDALMCKCKGIEIDFDGKPFQRIFNEWHDITELCGEDEE